MSYTFLFCLPRHAHRRDACWRLVIPAFNLDLAEPILTHLMSGAFRRALLDPHDTAESRVIVQSSSLSLLTFTRLSRSGDVLVNPKGGMCSKEGMEILAVVDSSVAMFPHVSEGSVREVSVKKWPNGSHFYITGPGIEFITKFNSLEAATKMAQAAFPNAKLTVAQ